MGNEEANLWKWEATSIAKLLRIKPKKRYDNANLEVPLSYESVVGDGQPAEKAVPTTEEDTGESTQESLTSATLNFFLPKQL